MTFCLVFKLGIISWLNARDITEVYETMFKLTFPWRCVFSQSEILQEILLTRQIALQWFHLWLQRGPNIFSDFLTDIGCVHYGQYQWQDNLPHTLSSLKEIWEPRLWAWREHGPNILCLGLGSCYYVLGYNNTIEI